MQVGLTPKYSFPGGKTSYARGWPRHSIDGTGCCDGACKPLRPLRTATLEEALSTRYDEDLFFVGYEPVAASPYRLTSAAVDHVEVRMQLFLADWDCHEAGADVDAWYEREAAPALERLLAAHPCFRAWRTRAGVRLVAPLATPVPLNSQEDAVLWKRLYVGWLSFLRREFGIGAAGGAGKLDELVDWQRLQRAPFVLRDGVRQEPTILGDGTGEGWGPPLQEEDLAAGDRFEVSHNHAATGEPTLLGHLLRKLLPAELFGREHSPGVWEIVCPLEEEHSSPNYEPDSDTLLYEDSGADGTIYCKHSHGADLRTPAAWLERLAFTEEQVAEAREELGHVIDDEAPAEDFQIEVPGGEGEAPAVFLDTGGKFERLQRWLGQCNVRYNTMTQLVEHCPERTGQWEEWTNAQTLAAMLQAELECVLGSDKQGNGKSPQKSAIEDAVDLVAHSRRYDPVAEYLASLPEWDGVGRVDRLLPEYFRCGSSALTKKAGLVLLGAMVSRAQRPGCQSDIVVTIAGAQGCKKSSALRALVPDEEMFSDAFIDLRKEADAAQAIQGCWLFEYAELAGLSKAGASHVKAFLTRRTDSYRAAYEKRKESHARRSVVVGTVNPSDEGFLQDDTGSRRYLICETTATLRAPIDVDAIARDRDQLWAEAKGRVAAGEQWWIDGELSDDQAAVAAKHEQSDDLWAELLEAWHEDGGLTRWNAERELEVRTGVPLTHYTMAGILEHALGIEPKDHDMRKARRVGAAARKLGWEKRKFQRGINQFKTWVPPPNH